MTETTTQSFRPPRGAAMTRMALSVLTATTVAAAVTVSERGYRGFTECGAWGPAGDVRSFTVLLPPPPAPPAVPAPATGGGAAGATCPR
ncbi:hypothetical protein GCM10009639_25670 [Kitasatospora putterlickiae]|uniref:Uncharacterized protein n=1 Tax=Kitasatospora putterlickiae TaxID=221725 RepID=A0ABN1XYN2_9ACTN